jgi:Tol biopolymer transport system component
MRGVYDIYVVSITVGEPKRITSKGSDARGLTWTHDSRKIVFSSNFGGRQELWQISANGSIPQLLRTSALNCYNPVISSTDKNLVYSEFTIIWNIWNLDIPTRDDQIPVPRKLIYSSKEDYGAQYSPNNKKIVFHSEQTGSAEIVICDSSGQNQVQLTSFNGPRICSSPQCSPDGQLILFAPIMEGNGDLFLTQIMHYKTIKCSLC